MADVPQQVKDAEARSDALLEQIRNPTPVGGGASATEASTNPQGQVDGEKPQAAPEQTVEYWRNRFQVLRGKYDAEVPRLHDQLKAEKAKVAEIETKLAEAAHGNPGRRSDPDLDQFDPELIDMTRRVAAEAAREALKPIEDRIRTAPDPAPTSGQEDERARFIDSLSDLVDDWESIDREMGWKVFLRQVEPDTGQPRQERLNRAVREFDVVTTASIFAAYRRARSAAPRASALDGEIVPGSAGSGAHGASAAEPKVWTRAEIRKFYSDVNSGKIRDQAQIQRTEKEIDQAVQEGRIRMA